MDADGSVGGSYGQAAALNAAAIGLPMGVSLWLDLEGVASYATAANTIAYVNAWAGEVAAAGFVPGLYVGANQPLTGDELYWRLEGLALLALGLQGAGHPLSRLLHGPGVDALAGLRRGQWGHTDRSRCDHG